MSSPILCSTVWSLIIILFLLWGGNGQYFGDGCDHSGDSVKDIDACGGPDSNMSCTEESICQCVGFPGDESGQAFEVAEDSMSCYPVPIEPDV